MIVHVLLPRVLADTNGGARELHVALPDGTVPAGPVPDGTVPDDNTLRSLFDAMAVSHVRLERRIRDEAGNVRRYVNVYVDGLDIRPGLGLETALTDGATVQVIPSVAGG